MAAVPSKKKQYQIIGVLGLFSLLTALAGSSTNLALPRIAIDLHVASSTATWIVQVALITTTILLVMFGHLGDLLSKNLVFTAGGLLFTFGSLLTGVAFDIVTMLVGRFIQAIGAAMVMANSMGIVTENFSDQNRAEALAAIAMFVSV
ncbi:MFS transporter, partial [Schleiferilactobacillus harbinensis]